jgi:glucose-1-phosphate thymidylyltransferase
MKALILAGGANTRLRPITHTRAKQLVPVANTPILHYGIRSIVAAGITELGVIVGDTRDEVMADLGDGLQFGASITFIPQEEPLGLAHCVLIARDLLGDDDFVCASVTTSCSRASRRSSRRSLPPGWGIGLRQRRSCSRRSTIRIDSASRPSTTKSTWSTSSISPPTPPSNLALVGVYLFDRKIHEAVTAIEPSGRGELEITDAIQWLIDHGRRVWMEILTDWWIDTCKLIPLLGADRLILETIATRIDGTVDDASFIDGRGLVEAGAEVVNSTIRGPVAIGPGTKVVDSFTGPFSAIGADCEICHSEIEHSVVMERSQVIDMQRLEDSLISSDAVVSRTKRKPRAIRLMVGDHCQIDVE